MKVLVTGGRGFIGRHVIWQLMQRVEIQAISNASRNFDGHMSFFFNPKLVEYVEDRLELTDEASVKSLLKSFQPDLIFHLGANPIVKENELFPCDITKANVLGTHHLLAYCKPGTRFIFASSATVYGDSFGIENGETKPTSIYGALKLASEELINVYWHLGRINPAIFRLVANVGPGATHGVLRDIVDKLKSDSTELELLGDYPGSWKPYTHVTDTAKFIVDAAMNPSLTGTVNVCSRKQISVEQLAKLAMAAIKIQKPIKWLGEQANWVGDNKSVLVSVDKSIGWGYHPRYSEDVIYQAAKEMQ